MNSMNETTRNLVASQKDLFPDDKTDKFDFSRSGLDNKLETQSSLLPRSGWQNRRDFLRVLIKAKQALDMAEITATLWH
jgi:hypothetical protein